MTLGVGEVYLTTNDQTDIHYGGRPHRRNIMGVEITGSSAHSSFGNISLPHQGVAITIKYDPALTELVDLWYSGGFQEVVDHVKMTKKLESLAEFNIEARNLLETRNKLFEAINSLNQEIEQCLDTMKTLNRVAEEK
jgi:hypothetical protein